MWEITIMGIATSLLISFCVANFAHILQNLCKAGNEYGVPPLSRIHEKIGNYLHKKRKYVLMKLHYCFKCQSVWYSIFASLVYYFAYFPPIAYLIPIPFFTWFFANLIIKDAFFNAPYELEQEE